MPSNNTTRKKSNTQTQKNTHFETSEVIISQCLTEARQAGVKRNYPKAITILEDVLLNETTFLKTHTSYLYKIYLLLCRAYTAISNHNRSVMYGKLLIHIAPNDWQAFFFLGRAFLLRKAYKKAIYCFEKTLRLKPNQLETLALLGYAYLKAHFTDDAIAIFEKALEIAPNSERLHNGYLNALFVSAVHHFKNSNYELARQMFTFVIGEGIDGVAPRLYLAHTLRSLKAFPEALTQYEAAIQFAPKDPSLHWYKALTLLQMHDVQAATDVLSALGLPIETDSISEQFLALGAIRQHIQKAEYSRAIVAARLYTKAFGTSPEIHLLTALAQKNLGHVKLAVNHYLRAQELEPENPVIYYGLFDLFCDTYNWDAMQKLLTNADKIQLVDADDLYFYKVITAAHIDNPPEQVLPHLQALVQAEKYATNSLLYNALGTCYIKLNMPELANTWYAKTLNKNSNDEEALIGLIACSEQDGNTKEISKRYTTYFLHHPTNLELRREYIQFLYSQKNWNLAINELETLALQSGRNHDTELAYALRKNGNYKRAALLYQHMLKKNPSEKILLHNFVYCLDKLGQTKAAIQLLQLARQTFGEHEDSLIIEGILCLHYNRKEDALRLFQYVAEHNPQNEIAKKYINHTNTLFAK